MKPRKMTGKGRGVKMSGMGMPKATKPSGGASMPSKGGR
jgi:hypothetical protein